MNLVFLELEWGFGDLVGEFTHGAGGVAAAVEGGVGGLPVAAGVHAGDAGVGGVGKQQKKDRSEEDGEERQRGRRHCCGGGGRCSSRLVSPLSSAERGKTREQWRSQGWCGGIGWKVKAGGGVFMDARHGTARGRPNNGRYGA